MSVLEFLGNQSYEMETFAKGCLSKRTACNRVDFWLISAELENILVRCFTGLDAPVDFTHSLEVHPSPTCLSRPGKIRHLPSWHKNCMASAKAKTYRRHAWQLNQSLESVALGRSYKFFPARPAEAETDSLGFLGFAIKCSQSHLSSFSPIALGR